MFSDNQCPLCYRAALLNQVNVNAYVECAKCGKYKIERLLNDTTFKPVSLTQETKDLMPYLSAYTRQASERSEDVFLTHDNWKTFAAAHSNTPVVRKLTRLLEIVAASTRPGRSAEVNPITDAPLLDAFDDVEVNFLIGTQRDLDLIEWSEKNNLLKLKAKGWERLQGVTGIPGKCFVAMSFDPDLRRIYEEGIRRAVKEDCNMDPVRVDLVPHNGNIIDKIVAEIRTCQFLVAGLTNHRQGVYFEGGFAMGLGRPVIWTCRKDDFENVHFDIAQFNTIRWESSEDLREKLADRIKATIPTA